MSSIGEEFEKPSATPHDAAFKAAFQKKELAKSFFRRFLPKAIVQQIDFRHMKLNNRSYVDEAMREKHSDIVYRTKIKGKTAFLYILFEHQSSPDHWIAFRLLCYMANLWREFLDQNPEARQLPVILPAVLYHGQKPWSAPRSFSEISDPEKGFEAYIPQFTYDFYNLGDYPDEQLLLGDYMALGVVLYLMKHIHDADYGDRFVQAAEYLGAIDDQKVQLEFLEWMLRYTFHARDDKMEYIDRGLHALGNDKARRMAMTIAERFRQEGEQRGERKALIKMMKRRFESVPPSMEDRIWRSDMALLDKFGDSIFVFKSLEDAERWWGDHGNEGNA